MIHLSLLLQRGAKNSHSIVQLLGYGQRIVAVAINERPREIREGPHQHAGASWVTVKDFGFGCKLEGGKGG